MTGVEEFLDALRDSLKDRSFRSLPARERMIPKAKGKLRRLSIATITNLSIMKLSTLRDRGGSVPAPPSSPTATARPRPCGRAVTSGSAWGCSPRWPASPARPMTASSG
jgi:hypothetical protein